MLVADDVKKRRGICRQYIFRNTPMFLFWSTIGLIWYFIVLLSERSNHILLRMIRTAVFYPRGAMWFLAASMVAVLLIGLLWDHKIILILLSGGYCFALIATTYYFLVNGTWIGKIVDLYMLVFISARNGIGVGLIYIGLGVWISKDNNSVMKWKMSSIVIVNIILYIILMFEMDFIYGKYVLDDSSCFMILSFLSVMIFVFALKISVPYSKEDSIKIRKISTYLYCLHPVFNDYVGTILFKIYNNYIMRFVVVLGLCFMTWIVTKNSKNKFIRVILP